MYAPIPHTHGGFGGGLCVEDVAAGEVINSGGGKRPSVRLSGYFVVHLLAGPKVDEAIRSAAWHYYRASILIPYECGLPTSCTVCGAVSRDDEKLGSTYRNLALRDYQKHQRT